MSMAAVAVEALLARAEEREAETQRGVTVAKELELEFDAGNLLAVDRNPAPRAVSRGGAAVEREAALRALARDNTQLLVGRLWALPSERAQEGGPVVARLPEPSTRLPREKPLPKARPPTRWEQFARLKGIRPTRKKRGGSLVWDEAAKEWRRRWGYGRAGGDPSRDWLLEVPPSADPLEDQFARRRREKRERVARNELNRLRNLARAHRGSGRGSGAAAELHPTGHQDRAELGRAAALARVSTASRGRFQPRLAKEPPAPQSNTARGRKRRFGPLVGDLGREKERQLELARSLSSGRPPLDLARAVSKQLRQDEEEARAAKAEAAGGRGKKRGQRGKRARRQQQRPGGAKGKKSRGRPGSALGDKRGKKKKK